jgi:prolipoprotein diacylglyceryl transferase
MQFLTEVPHFPNPPISSFSIGPFTVHLYALCILIGIIVAYLIGASRFKKRGGDSGTLLDIILWAVPFGIVGARIFHVLTHLGDYVGVYPTIEETMLHIVSIWEGGIAIYGALIFGTLGAWIGAHVSGVRFVSVLDVLAPGIILAQGIGRWGNYFNQELFGQATDLPWGLLIEKNGNAAYPSEFPAGTLFHPTFLYEFLWDVAGFFVIIYLAKRLKLQWGKVFALYLVVYSIGRYFVEGIRLDPSEVFFGLRTNQWSAVVGVAIGIAIYLIQSRRHTGLEPDVYLPGRRPVEETKSEPEKPNA